MTNLRGGTHTTLTETAELVVRVLETIPEVKNISPGIINQTRSRSGRRFITVSFTNAGLEFIITGQGVQKVAVHAAPEASRDIYNAVSSHKRLTSISFKTRNRKPGI